MTSAATSSGEWQTLLDAASAHDLTAIASDVTDVVELLELVDNKQPEVVMANVDTTGINADTAPTTSTSISTTRNATTAPAAVVVRQAALSLACLDDLFRCRRLCGWYRKSQYRAALLVVNGDIVRMRDTFVTSIRAVEWPS